LTLDANHCPKIESPLDLAQIDTNGVVAQIDTNGVEQEF
jgi:hypothetical protein